MEGQPRIFGDFSLRKVSFLEALTFLAIAMIVIMVIISVFQQQKEQNELRQYIDHAKMGHIIPNSYDSKLNEKLSGFSIQYCYTDICNPTNALLASYDPTQIEDGTKADIKVEGKRIGRTETVWVTYQNRTVYVRNPKNPQELNEFVAEITQTN